MASEREPVAKENDDCILNIKADATAPKVGESTEIREETPSSSDRRRQNLVLQVPSRDIEDAGEEFVRINMPTTPSPPPKRVNFSPLPSPSFARVSRSPGPSSSKTISNIKNLLPKLSFKNRNSNSEIQKAVLLALEGSPAGRQEKRLFSRTLSLTKRFTPRFKNSSSLPVTPIAHSNPESMHGGNMNGLLNPAKGGARVPIHRSQSVPVLSKHGSISMRSVFRVIPTTPRASERTIMTTSSTAPEDDSDGSDDGGEDIPEEEAVCRICFVELGEGADTLKMECSCKGELALAHQECAIKWFSIKGNKICEVCKQEVRNLPVTLLRIQNSQGVNLRGNRTLQAEVTQYRVWQDVPVLVIVSMLAYFCFLEQLLVGKMGSGAIAISLPFSCVLGLLASITATTMVRRKHVWIYASVQFGLVVLSAHLLYSLLHMQGVLSVLLATFTGFGVTMCGNSILVEVLKWRRGRRARANQQVSLEAREMHQPPAIPQQTQTNNPNHDENRQGGNSDVIHGN
ncbi:Zinc finger, RING-CH-type [Parasponia andersonii]|uniref:Zinc finger, RING-CH-type n=1 Tax=Parasponia andersonii TaxID=3476 RepID=A0A2P5D7Q3_PARAD|nr:Zinc finger, RING-CH-type [Parasponia andersonii]